MPRKTNRWLPTRFFCGFWYPKESDKNCMLCAMCYTYLSRRYATVNSVYDHESLLWNKELQLTLKLCSSDNIEEKYICIRISRLTMTGPIGSSIAGPFWTTVGSCESILVSARASKCYMHDAETNMQPRLCNMHPTLDLGTLHAKCIHTYST